jgi:thioredoxin-related protein
MKKFLHVLILSVIVFSCEPSANENAYDRSMKMAQRESKLILFDFTAVWCGGCKAYDKYVFSNKEISDHIKENYILLKIDADDPGNSEFVKKYEVTGLPHIIMTDTHGEILGSILGFDGQFVDQPEQFLVSLLVIRQSTDKIKGLEVLLHADSTDLSTVTNLLNACQEVGRHMEVRKLKKMMVQLLPTEENLFNDRFDQAMRSLKIDGDPQPMLSIIEECPSLDYKHRRTANAELLHYAPWTT